MKNFLFPVLLILISCKQPQNAERGKLRIIIDSFECVNTAAHNGDIFADLLTEKILKSGSYSVIDRSKLQSLMKEKALAQMGAVEAADKLSGSGILGADILMTGSIIVKGETAYITVKSIRITTGENLYTEVFKVKPDVDLSQFIEKNLQRVGITKGKRFKQSAR